MLYLCPHDVDVDVDIRVTSFIEFKKQRLGIRSLCYNDLEAINTHTQTDWQLRVSNESHKHCAKTNILPTPQVDTTISMRT